ncbi:MAG: hypothetical protein HY290_13820 [Planctomycetia bacterium]|nr:hypothetical protein [Planctomycetia bacterium]
MRDKPPGGSPRQTPPADHLSAGRRWLGVTALLAVAWSLALLAMDIWTAGRPVVGPGQIRKADVVVTATLTAAGNDRIEVQRVFKGHVALGSRLKVVDLADVPQLATGKSYIFALTHFRDAYEVTKLEGQRGGLLVYPATQETIEQTKAILREGG